jgi:hypothetical protein
LHRIASRPAPCDPNAGVGARWARYSGVADDFDAIANYTPTIAPHAENRAINEGAFVNKVFKYSIQSHFSCLLSNVTFASATEFSAVSSWHKD